MKPGRSEPSTAILGDRSRSSQLLGVDRRRRRRIEHATSADRRPRRGTQPGAWPPRCSARVVAAPVPVPATDGKDHLAYELQLTNALGQDVTLTSLAVVAGDQTLLTLSGDKLAYWTRVARATPTPTTKLGPGPGAIVWLDVVVDGRAHRCPHELTAHARRRPVRSRMPPLLPATMTEDVAPVTVSDPQAGRHRAAAGRPELVGRQQLLRHDRAPDGDEPAQRQAVGRRTIRHRLRAARRRRHGCSPATSPSRRATRTSAPTSTRSPTAPWSPCSTGCPSRSPGKSPTGLPLDQYGGNHIVQDIGDGNYAFYAHLKTGSVKVKPGDRAHRRAR